MKIRELIGHWEQNARGQLTQETYCLHLDLESAARLNALAEMYPKRNVEVLLGELVSAAWRNWKPVCPTSRAARWWRWTNRAIRSTRTSVPPHASWRCPGSTCSASARGRSPTDPAYSVMTCGVS